MDRYPAFTVHYRARFAELEGILNFGIFKIVTARLSILNWEGDELIHQFPEEIDETTIHLRWNQYFKGSIFRYLSFYPRNTVIILKLYAILPKANGYSLFHPETMNRKSPINPEDSVYKSKNINESIHYTNNYSRISKGGHDWLMMIQSF